MRHLKNNNDENKDISNNNENKSKKENLLLQNKILVEMGMLIYIYKIRKMLDI